ncbi:MAG: L-histidine N(alpha)-methyltransferase [Rhodospirillaceae bacterium]|jgi:L-histidine Nalpha-methyltransferase|nr:L-histidine N(alpha)-methyltransferase [Rhodospirillaceae bacterium]MBT6116644.1 L-histidine N(alpha)-methyltransferase [Rhodospirillaceae bacterium]
MTASAALSSFRDEEPDIADFRTEALAGLRRAPRTLPCKFFYDEAGSRLFEQITALPEYYLTRTEEAILAECVGEIAALAGPGCQVIEYGSGAIRKARILIDALNRPAGYVAVDISRDHLIRAAEALAGDYPDLEVHAVCTDYTTDFVVPGPKDRIAARRLGFFPGSTIGNFETDAAREFLAAAARTLGRNGAMVIGTDLQKDKEILEAAYDDAAGVTAAFNLHLLERINEELGGTFDLDRFRHVALYNDSTARIEMHIESLAEQSVEVADETFAFAEGERIHTENSHKYTVDGFCALAASAGFEAKQTWSDEDGLFAVHYLAVAN